MRSCLLTKFCVVFTITFVFFFVSYVKCKKTQLLSEKLLGSRKTTIVISLKMNFQKMEFPAEKKTSMILIGKSLKEKVPILKNI